MVVTKTFTSWWQYGRLETVSPPLSTVSGMNTYPPPIFFDRAKPSLKLIQIYRTEREREREREGRTKMEGNQSVSSAHEVVNKDDQEFPD